MYPHSQAHKTLTMRKKDDTPELERIALALDKVADDMSGFTLILDPKAHEEIITTISVQIRQSERELRAIARRFRRMSKLAENSTGTYVVLGEDGNLRPATVDEAIRAQMHFLPAGVSVWQALNYGHVDEKRDIVVMPDQE